MCQFHPNESLESAQPLPIPRRQANPPPVVVEGGRGTLRSNIVTMRNVTGSVFSLFVLLTLTPACGGVKTQQAAKVEPTQEAEEIVMPKLEPGEIVLEGRLERTVERGGWVLETETETYLLLAVENFRTKSWFKEDVRVKAIGKEAPDVITIFMQGTPFRVRELEPITPD